MKKISFRNIVRSHFPTKAARATKSWEKYRDSIELPAIVLMENMKDDFSEIVFLSFKNLDHLLVPADVERVRVEETEQEGGIIEKRHRIVNSQVLYVSLSQEKNRVIVTEPINMWFEHKVRENVTNPKCVHWDFTTNAWSTAGCKLLFTNSSHSRCSCGYLSSFALLDEVEEEDGMSHISFLVVVIITVSFITLLSLVLVIIYCRKLKVSWCFLQCRPLVIICYHRLLTSDTEPTCSKPYHSFIYSLSNLRFRITGRSGWQEVTFLVFKRKMKHRLTTQTFMLAVQLLPEGRTTLLSEDHSILFHKMISW